MPIASRAARVISVMMNPGPFAFGEVVEALRAGLPRGTRVWVGGAAALPHAAAAEGAGFGVFREPGDWTRLAH